MGKKVALGLLITFASFGIAVAAIVGYEWWQGRNLVSLPVTESTNPAGFIPSTSALSPTVTTFGVPTPSTTAIRHAAEQPTLQAPEQGVATITPTTLADGTLAAPSPTATTLGALTHDDVAQVADVNIEGEHLPPFEGHEPDPAMETVAPAFAATTFGGVEVSVLPGNGTAKVIGFFAHWCPHCQRELPRITNWLAANQLPAGVEVIAVSAAVDSGRPNYPPSAWFEEEQWPEVVVRDSESNEIGDAYGLRGFPYMVAVDADGRVVARVSGELTDAAWEFLLRTVAPAAG